MDALSDVLRLIRLTGGVFLDAEFSAPWCVKSQIRPEDWAPFLPEVAQIICYHYVADGPLVVQIGAEAPVTLNAGNIVLFPRNDVHYLGSAIEGNPINCRELMQPRDDGGLPRIVCGGGGRQTRLVCGFLGTEVQSGPLLATLPPMLTMNVAGTPGGDWIMQCFTFASQEIASSEPGAATILSKMSELLFVEAVRRYLATLPSEETGWLAGLRDPVVGRALALLHTGVAQAWTAEMLSRAVGLSRSAFADRFTGLIGQPPMHYLTAWRMQVAGHKLRQETGSIAQIAFGVGYDSEAAFTRAFKRHFGAPPSSWRAKKTGTIATHLAGALPAALRNPRE